MRKPPGYLTLTLHAHLPWVVNHGTWPHGMEWLHEATAETYLPLLRMLGRLERDGVPFACNLDLSPVLLEQLAHPLFQAEFPKYLRRKIVAAQEDEAFFRQSGEAHYAYLAQMWNGFFSEALTDYEALSGDLIAGFRHHSDDGRIDLLTCCATHGYLPLLGTDESVYAQVRTALAAHQRHLGRAPHGIWLPECGYRPAGWWNYPVRNADGTANPSFDRVGVEQVVRELGLDFFFVDTHLVEGSSPVRSPYGPPPEPAPESVGEPERDVYQPYLVAGPYRATEAAVTAFPRDPRTGVQVWSGELGYPGDGAYLDFHKKRWPGGHRYWRVTGAHVDIGGKQPYVPDEARARVQEHARHFVELVPEALQAGPPRHSTPILCAPFDAELFGHWWFEGTQWLEAVARRLAAPESITALIGCHAYLVQQPAQEAIALREGSWGAAGGDQVWLNPETSWTWSHIYPAERALRGIVSSGGWRGSDIGTRLVQQLCRELLLLESSDWQFLITTGAARDYAESRFLNHNDIFHELRGMWDSFLGNGALSPEALARLAEISARDDLFPDIDPEHWADGAFQASGQPERMLGAVPRGQPVARAAVPATPATP